MSTTKKKTVWIFIFTLCLAAAVGGYRYIQYTQLTPEEKAYQKKIKAIASLFKSAKKQSQKKEFKAAIEDYKKILALQPDHVDAKVLLASTLAWDKQYDEALRELEEILKDHPNHLDALFALANVYRWRGKEGDSEKSKVILSDILKRDPNHKEAQELLKKNDRY